ncbi:hypothetical protein BOTBODRAFT_364133 [Botryobasidium botryosum FD-172 SS1]|uniref:Carbonic anhydrase n=1 Tax=Botryobasidium botryosum (strain FD-172 SS1) TaxID=930990 RepID=A0A067MDK5_BOTB1|nr:hypothetical protein BOTBODRAFT_364133 [Botryobasidium botryosum FD-172 SS1]
MTNESDIVGALLKSNEAWATSVVAKDPDFFKKSAEGQAPKVLWLGCSDSRVPESVLLAAMPGEILVHRNMGNQFRDEDGSSQGIIDYAANHARVDHIFVVGHTRCGACRACIEGAPPGPIANFFVQLIELAQAPHITELPKPEAIERLVRDNLTAQLMNVVNSKPVKNAWSDGRQLQVHGLLYHLETGRLEHTGMTFGPNHK